MFEYLGSKSAASALTFIYYLGKGRCIFLSVKPLLGQEVTRVGIAWCFTLLLNIFRPYTLLCVIFYARCSISHGANGTREITFLRPMCTVQVNRSIKEEIRNNIRSLWTQCISLRKEQEQEWNIFFVFFFWWHSSRRFATIGAFSPRWIFMALLHSK